MPITIDDPFIAPPRMTRERFVQVLTDAGSPWMAQAGAIFDLISGSGHDPSVWLAICAAEHSYGTNRDSVLWRNDTRSWTNARTVRDPTLTGWSIVHDTVRNSDYVRYASVEDSIRDGMYRITDPTHRYVCEGRTSIAQVFAIWTERDGAQYARSAVRRMNAWANDAAPPSGEPNASILSGLVDIRHRLATRDPQDGVHAGPYERRPFSERHGLVLHYSGPPVRERANTLAVLQTEARYHVDKNWARAGELPLYGDGLMYHIAIGDDGVRYLCRDLDCVLWHCGAWPQNALSLAVHIPIGGEQHATPAQLDSLRGLVDEWCAATHTPPEEVWGHQELSPTDCPGTLMNDFIYPYRAGKRVSNDDGHWFPETGHYVGGAFWRFWQARGGVAIFGYPLSDERREGGRTTQYFERAVFEWHPEQEEPWKVLLRRLGADALARRS